MTSTLTPMPPERHAAIRRMLLEEVAATGTPARGRRPARRWTLAGVALVTAATAVVAFVLVAGDPTAPAGYASWTAVPETAPGAPVSHHEIEAWASKCTDLKVGGVAVEGVPARAREAAARKVLVDRRGDFTFCADVSLGSGTASDPLIALSGVRADSGRFEDLNTMSSTVSDKPFTPPTGDNVMVLVKPVDMPADTEEGVLSLEVHQIVGLAGGDVRGVDIVLANGLRVTATVQDGIWAAWWPSDKGPAAGSALEVRTGAGSRTVPPDDVELHLE